MSGTGRLGVAPSIFRVKAMPMPRWVKGAKYPPCPEVLLRLAEEMPLARSRPTFMTPFLPF